MNNGWTGGQYSVFRALFGAYLLVHFAALVPWGPELFSARGAVPEASASPLHGLFPNLLAVAGEPAVVTAFLVGACAASVAFALGVFDRLAALFLWYALACLVGRNPLLANPSLPFVGWLLLAHLFVPRAPFGSFAARGRVDPDGGWAMPPRLFAVAWIVAALAYAYSGWTKLSSPSWRDGTALARILENPLARPGPIRDSLLALPDGPLRVGTWATLGLELGFAPAVLFRALRPLAWGAMLAMHLALVAVLDFADPSLGMAALHGFLFDPAWIRPRRAPAPSVLYYDGTCGVCHRFVRFLLAEDRTGDAFRFAPLGGESFRLAWPGPERARLPDSVVVTTPGGETRVRSAAVIHALERLGGFWRVVGGLARLAPAPLRDLAYDGLARVRRRLAPRPADVCPVLPARLRARFLP